MIRRTRTLGRRSSRRRVGAVLATAAAIAVASIGFVTGCAPPADRDAPDMEVDAETSADGGSASTGADEPSIPGPPPERARSVLSNDASWRITWWTDPATIPMHELHAVEVRVERAGEGAEPIPDDLVLTADARMPHHRHGMMVQPDVEKLAPDRFRVRGMMLHMSGYWEYYFDVESAGVIERAQDSIELE